jgi:hypothetical protein
MMISDKITFVRSVSAANPSPVQVSTGVVHDAVRRNVIGGSMPRPTAAGQPDVAGSL